MMRFSNPEGDRETQPRPAFPPRTRSRGIGAEKSFENPRMQLGWYARPGVDDVYLARRGCSAAGNIHAAALSRVLDGVVQKIQNHSAQQCLITVNQAFRGRIDGQLNMFF